MDIQANRARRLSSYIDKHYEGVVADFVQATDENAGMISSLINGKKSFGERLARRLEGTLGIEAGWFDRPAVEDDDKSGAEVSAGSWVPVVGEARLGDNGYFTETAFDPGTEGYVLYPEAAPGVVALRCKGDSMYPAIHAGDYVVISQRGTPREGDLVMCQTIDGRRMIKNLGRHRDGSTQFLSLNHGFNPITLDEDEIAHLYRADGPIKPRYYKPA